VPFSANRLLWHRRVHLPGPSHATKGVPRWSKARSTTTARSAPLATRAVNERLVALDKRLSALRGTSVIARQCADAECVPPVPITSEAYQAVRAKPRRFAVLADHVLPAVERVVATTNDYVVVEKFAVAAQVAEAATL
jgi:hypothetical protein